MARRPEESEAPFWEHVGELRRRMIVSAAAIVAAAVVAFIFNRQIFAVIMLPLQHIPGAVDRLLTLGPAEPFVTVLRVSVYAGLIGALPIILWQTWAFVAPALYEREKRIVAPYVFFFWILFLGGVVFGYFIVLPVGLRFLLSYGGDLFDQQLRAAEYVSFVTTFLLGMGIVFEMPAVLLVLSALHLVKSRVLRRVRRYAVLAIAVLAMVITPTQDPVTMIVLMVPLLLLYELGILLVRMVERRRVKARTWGAGARTGEAEERARLEEEETGEK